VCIPSIYHTCRVKVEEKSLILVFFPVIMHCFLCFSLAFNILVNVGVVLTYPILISIGTVLSVPGNAGTSDRGCWWKNKHVGMQTAEAVYCLSSQNPLSHSSKAVQSPLASMDAPGHGGCFSWQKPFFLFSCLLSLGVTGCVHTMQRRGQADQAAAQHCAGDLPC